MPPDLVAPGTAPLARPTPSTLKSHIFNGLREAIVSGRYRPGERLNESKIAREFGISRIPVREALMQLQEHGLVMNLERRGMFVTQLSEEDVQRINSLRVVLEAEALKLCRLKISKQDAARLTDIMERMEAWTERTEMDAAALDLEFHRTLWQAAGNPYLTKTLDSLVTSLFAHKALEYVSADLKRWSLHHHRALLDVALGQSNIEPEAAIIIHLRTAYNEPERFSSFGAAKAPADEAPAGKTRDRKRKA
ncbi:MAG TPA: GntR family transcriptional regulator [Steroidobacteraceae bacterium]|jgi:DNA-binding GntR family transcriptional regulator|nr:GntR family transcriptional regulator [Steroidobacteraceae bacterium]